MRVVIDARMFGAATTTGIGVYIEELVREYAKVNDGTQYILLTQPAFDRSVLPSNAAIRCVPTSIPWYSWSEQFRLPRLLARLKPDLVHFPQFNVPIAYRGRFVVTIHDITPALFPGPNVRRSLLRRAGFTLTFRHALRNARRVITISEHTAKLLEERYGIDRARLTITPLGVRQDFGPVSPDVCEPVLRRYHITQPYLLYVGVWRDHKNLPGLISAHELLVKQGRRVELVLCGTPDARYPEIMAAIDASSARELIRMPGFVPDQDLHALYGAAQVFVLPSFSEGFGLVALEAVACGTPVAASNTTSVPEVLGELGHYFDPHSSESIANVVGKLLDTPAARQAVSAGSKDLLARYRWESCAQSTARVYHECNSVV